MDGCHTPWTTGGTSKQTEKTRKHPSNIGIVECSDLVLKSPQISAKFARFW